MPKRGVAPRSWTHKDVERSVQWRAEGLSSAEIGRRLGRTVHALYDCWLRHGYTRRVLSAEQKALIRVLVGKGQSDRQVAKMVGCQRETVRVWRKKWGLPGLSPSEAAKRGNWTRRRREGGWQSNFERLSYQWRVEAARAGWPPVSPADRRVLEAVEAGTDTARGQAAAFGITLKAACNRLARLVSAEFLEPAPGSGRLGRKYVLAPGVAEGRLVARLREAG